MNFAARITMILAVMLTLAGNLTAQQTATAASTTAPATTTAGEAQPAPADPVSSIVRSEESRQEFDRILSRHPSAVWKILALDPTMVSNEPFLARYPELKEFLAQHPEVARNPHYYMARYGTPGERVNDSEFGDAVEAMGIASIFFLIAFALGWLLRTIIEQRRWTHLARRQSEVHNKILDRFSSSDELLQYIKSPAGTKFLESAPIPLRSEPPAQTGPFARIAWSIQLGVIIAAGGIGLLVVSGGFSGETAQGFFALGAIALSIGIGFIASAVVSIFLSRRLGIWQGTAGAPRSAFEDSGQP